MPEAFIQVTDKAGGVSVPIVVAGGEVDKLLKTPVAGAMPEQITDWDQPNHLLKVIIPK
ncbi:MAG: hypothetical protein NTW19_01190 [Planctomycetota bacterium]|nr:hypothetical protein [Planctomycetota bacterium]